MSRKNSDVNYRANYAAMCSNWNRLLSLVPDNIRNGLRAEHSLRYRIGIDEDMRPCQLGYTGKIKPEAYPWLFEQLKHLMSEEQRLWESEYSLRHWIVDRMSVDHVMRFVEVCTGEELLDAFADKRPGSCMRYTECRPWLSMYADNPDKVAVMVLDCKPLFEGYASWLLWKYDDGTYYHDCEYCYSASGIVSMVRSKIRKVYPEHSEDGYEYLPDVTLNVREGTLLPYMDTYIYCREYDGCTVTLGTTYSAGDEEVQDCDGWLPGRYRTYDCPCCGAELDSEEATVWCEDEIETRCRECASFCSLSCVWRADENVSYFHVICNGFSLPSTYCESMVWLEENGYLETHNGTWCHESQVVETVCGKLVFEDDKNLSHCEETEEWTLITA